MDNQSPRMDTKSMEEKQRAATLKMEGQPGETSGPCMAKTGTRQEKVEHVKGGVPP